MTPTALRAAAERVTLSADEDFTGQHETDAGKIAAYAAAMRDGDIFPPIRVVDYDGTFMIVDGHHRVAAARLVGCDIDAWIVGSEAFEDFDAANRHLGVRADDAQWWPQ